MPASIPVYHAQTFEREMEGGRNHPWLLSVDTGRNIDLYVAKFFAEQDVNQQNALGKEIYASVLAQALGLYVPDFALINVTNSFLRSLTKEQRKILENKHTRYAFGTKFIPGNFTFSPAQYLRDLADYDIESIFAFDVLVLNTDRRNKKPNILLDDKKYYLIDHEHTLLLSAQTLNPKRRVAAYRFNNHIFHAALNRKATYGKPPEFATFIEHFRRLNVNILNSYAAALENIGYETDDSLVIKQYLTELKRDIPYFINIVKGGVQ